MNLRDLIKNRPEPFRNELAKFTYMRTYARWIEEEGRREDWGDTVLRYCNHLFSLSPGVLTEDEQKELLLAVYDHKIAGSNRLLWSAGETVRNNPMTAYNCSAIAVDGIGAFSEIMFVLMSGAGIGVSVEQKFIDRLPRVAMQGIDPLPNFHVVEDSREGWAEALMLGITHWFYADDIIFDYSYIRPAGARLKTMGGRASGPFPLKNLLDFTRKKILSRQGKKLRAIDVSDIVNMIGEVVVAGGVRRSSEIILFDSYDIDMINAKKGAFWETTPWRAMSNNSGIFSERPKKSQFDDYWQSLRDNRTGEPGFFNRAAWRKTSPRRKDYPHMLVNPCVTGDTIISTLGGPRTIKELADVGEDVLVHAIDLNTSRPVVRWMRRPHRTRIGVPVLKVTFDSGLVLKMTSDHRLITFRGKKVKAKNLKVGKSIRAFSLYEGRRTGEPYNSITGWNRELNCSQEVLEHHAVWELFNGKIPEGFVIHHKNGIKNDNRISNLEILSSYDHQSEHYVQRALNGFRNPNISKEKLEAFKECHNHKVVSIQEDGLDDVYNGCVDDVHTYVILDPKSINSAKYTGIYSANCGEISLRSRQTCNLSTVIVRSDDTYQSLLSKVSLATKLGTLQSLISDFSYLSSEWTKNQNEERLLGVSITGLMDHPRMLTPYVLQGLKETAVLTNRLLSHKLGINTSAAITCIKPEGTTGLYTDTSPGMHSRFSPFYVRRVRISATDPLLKLMDNQGYNALPEVGQSKENAATWVLEFPVKAPHGSVFRDHEDALSQLNRYILLKTNYTEHNPSCTIYVKNHEWEKLGREVFSNWDNIQGISFLPHNDHVYQLAPYEEITESVYERMKNSLPSMIDYRRLNEYEREDLTHGSKEIACNGNSCDI